MGRLVLRAEGFWTQCEGDERFWMHCKGGSEKIFETSGMGERKKCQGFFYTWIFSRFRLKNTVQKFDSWKKNSASNYNILSRRSHSELGELQKKNHPPLEKTFIIYLSGRFQTFKLTFCIRSLKICLPPLKGASRIYGRGGPEILPNQHLKFNAVPPPSGPWKLDAVPPSTW